MRWLVLALLLAGCQGQGELLPWLPQPSADKPVEFIVPICSWSRMVSGIRSLPTPERALSHLGLIHRFWAPWSFRHQRLK